MKYHSFKLAFADTDSISICKPDGSPFNELERQSLLIELNSLFPPKITWADDGYFEKALVLKAKNHVLERDGKRKTKGSALKATTKEPALREFIDRVLDALITEQSHLVPSIYNEYVREIHNVQDINRWASKKTVTEAVLSSGRTNEAKVRDAIESAGLQMGDKFYVYFATDDSLKLATNWTGDHNVGKLLKKLHDTLKVFEPLVNSKEYPNYTLKRSQPALKALLSA